MDGKDEFALYCGDESLIAHIKHPGDESRRPDAMCD